jgi:hypothetical protein
MKKRPAKSPRPRESTRLSVERQTEMVEEATVDAYGESEQATGWFTIFENNLALPFETKVLGTSVTVSKLLLTDDNRITALCTRGRDRQLISLVDLPLPSPKPIGSEWIEAYRRWLGRL